MVLIILTSGFHSLTLMRFGLAFTLHSLLTKNTGIECRPIDWSLL